MRVSLFPPMKFLTLNRKTDAASEPVTLAEAKKHLRVTSADDDTYITTLITVARQNVEEQLRRSLVTQTWEAGFEGWPEFTGFTGRPEFRGFGRQASRGFELPRPKAISVTSLEYWDQDGVKVTMPGTDYTVDLFSFPAILRIKEATALPALSPDLPAPILITYVAGFGNAAAVPAPIKHAILLMISHLFEIRVIASAVPLTKVPDSISCLLSPYKLRLV